MADDIMRYRGAIEDIKSAILQSQYEAAKDVNAKQLQLYYVIGEYISSNIRNGCWGSSALETISTQLQKELPGLRGFSRRNMYYMKTFYEEWSVQTSLQEDASSDDRMLVRRSLSEDDDARIVHSQVHNSGMEHIEGFFSIGFTHHRTILELVEQLDERLFYIRRCAEEHWSVKALKRAIQSDEYHHQGMLPNNFLQAMPQEQRALRAIEVFKDEYLLDFINVEELGVRDGQDVDERVLEQGLIHIKRCSRGMMHNGRVAQFEVSAGTRSFANG